MSGVEFAARELTEIYNQARSLALRWFPGIAGDETSLRITVLQIMRMLMDLSSQKTGRVEAPLPISLPKSRPEITSVQPGLEPIKVKGALIAKLPWVWYDGQEGKRGWLLSDSEKPTRAYELTDRQKDLINQLVEKVKVEGGAWKSIIVEGWRVSLGGDRDQFLRIQKVA